MIRVEPFSVAIVGGGLAGLAAAAALASRGLSIEVFEAKRRLGGRAGSFLARQTGQLVDHCQHVALGCCTNFLDFCRRTGIAGLFERHRTLHFVGPDGRRSDFFPAWWLPAPLHMGPAVWGLRHLSLGDKLAIARGMLRLVRTPRTDSAESPTILSWLKAIGQPPRAIEQFWQVVLVSALGESLDRASLAAARKVIVDGFLASRDASDVHIPAVSLGMLYERVANWLREHGVAIHLESPVRRVGNRCITLADGTVRRFDAMVLAVPWRYAAALLSPEIQAQLPQLVRAAEFASAPISSVHLWFDQPITKLPHAVLVGRLSQWVFARRGNEPYYQVVISASHDLAGRERQEVVDEVLGDLRAAFPAAGGAQVLRWQLITEHDAVFSPRPGLDELRPPQKTQVPGLFLAGDWTATGWPATMESAVRSGRLAAEGVLTDVGRPERLLV